MKYIKWREITLKLGIYYIVLKKKVVARSKQIRFRKEKKEEEPCVRPYMPGGNPTDGDTTFGLGAGATQLTVRFWNEMTNLKIEKRLAEMLLT